MQKIESKIMKNLEDKIEQRMLAKFSTEKVSSETDSKFNNTHSV